MCRKHVIENFIFPGRKYVVSHVLSVYKSLLDMYILQNLLMKSSFPNQERDQHLNRAIKVTPNKGAGTLLHSPDQKSNIMRVLPSSYSTGEGIIINLNKPKRK